MTHLLSMAQYKQAEITNVFWASNDGFKGGRDPLDNYVFRINNIESMIKKIND